MRPINLTHAALDFLQGLSPKQFKQVTAKLLSLLKDPYPQDCIHVSGHPGVRRVSVGEYRICYLLTNDCVKIIVVGPRNDDAVYKKLRQVSRN